jgi:hypothetical protein
MLKDPVGRRAKGNVGRRVRLGAPGARRLLQFAGSGWLKSRAMPFDSVPSDSPGTLSDTLTEALDGTLRHCLALMRQRFRAMWQSLTPAGTR